MGRTVAALAASHVVVVGWTAWYMAEAAWESAPLAASPTPLPPIVFVACSAAGTAFLLAAGIPLGAALTRGPWIGADPTLVLPLGAPARTASAWIASGAIMGGVALAAVPVYVGLHAMGAFAGPAILRPVLVQVGTIAVAPLPGIVLARAWQRLVRGRLAAGGTS